jgi:hypothetical protein
MKPTQQKALSITTWISKGDLNLTEPQKLSIKEWLDGRDEQITVKFSCSSKKGRSLNQNNYYYGVIIQLIVDFTGEDASVVHEYLKWQFLRDDSTPISRTKSTTNLSTVEAEDYYMKCRRWAFDTFGIFIPIPNEPQPMESENSNGALET